MVQNVFNNHYNLLKCLVSCILMLILVLNTMWACFGHGFVRLTTCKSVFALTKTKSTSNFNMKFSPSYEFYEYIFGHNFTLKKAVV